MLEDPIGQLAARHYRHSFRQVRLSCVSGSGLSGARLWRIETDRKAFCLRRWPVEHPSPDKLRWIHAVLAHAVGRGVDYLAVPLVTNRGDTFFQDGGYLWELTPWLPGEADFHRNPSPQRLAAAMQALARFHLAVEDFPGAAVQGRSCTVEERVLMLQRWDRATLDRLQRTISREPESGFQSTARQILADFRAVSPRIPEIAPPAPAAVVVPLQPCLRDVWDQHLLFLGDRVSGLIDYGAMRHDTVACDLARLTAGLAEDDQRQWHQALEHYSRVRPLADAERQLVHWLDRSSTLLSGMNWLRWLYLERKFFSNPKLIRQRMELAARRLRRLATSS